MRSTILTILAALLLTFPWSARADDVPPDVAKRVEFEAVDGRVEMKQGEHPATPSPPQPAVAVKSYVALPPGAVNLTPTATITASVKQHVPGRLLFIDSSASAGVVSQKWYVSPKDGSDFEPAGPGRYAFVPRLAVTYTFLLVVAGERGDMADTTLILEPIKPADDDGEPDDNTPFASVAPLAHAHALTAPNQRSALVPVVRKLVKAGHAAVLANLGGCLHSVRGQMLTGDIRDWAEADRALKYSVQSALGPTVVNVADAAAAIDRILESERGADVQRLQQVLFDLASVLTQGK